VTDWSLYSHRAFEAAKPAEKNRPNDDFSDLFRNWDLGWGEISTGPCLDRAEWADSWAYRGAKAKQGVSS